MTTYRIGNTYITGGEEHNNIKHNDKIFAFSRKRTMIQIDKLTSLPHKLVAEVYPDIALSRQHVGLTSFNPHGKILGIGMYQSTEDLAITILSCTRFSLTEYEDMSRLTRNGTAEPVSRDQILRRERGQGRFHFPCSGDDEQD